MHQPGFWSADRLERLVAAVRAAPARLPGTAVVAVDGPSGSGKSVLACELGAALGGAPVVRMDDLYPGWDGLDDAAPRLVEWVLGPLGRGAPARYRRFDWEAGEYAEWHEVPSAPVLLVEGCGSGARACAPALALLVWMEAAPEVRMARGIARDGEVYRPHWERWAEQEAAHFPREGTRERADVRLETSGGPLL